jgi:hypothetical protein
MRFALIAATALASVAAASSASAQVGFGVYVGPSGYYDDYETAPPTYRTRRDVYGYSSGYEYERRPGVVVRGPIRRGGCGQFFYWDGTQCVDARSNPPDLR